VAFDGREPILLGSGTGAVSNGHLGLFDPTLLPNDSYLLRLTATDDGGHVSVTQVQVQVEGQLKLGNFRLEFTDLAIPVAGIPIAVTRTYDTLDAYRNGDFGYGWRLNIGDAKLQVNLADNDGSGWDNYPPFKDGTRVYVTFPGGERQGFTFQGVLVNDFFQLWAPVFIPDDGNLMFLTVPDALLTREENGEYTSYDESGIHTYNPADLAYGGIYTLHDPFGMKQTVRRLVISRLLRDGETSAAGQRDRPPGLSRPESPGGRCPDRRGR
jgi:hypothetical protein